MYLIISLSSAEETLSCTETQCNSAGSLCYSGSII